MAVACAEEMQPQNLIVEEAVPGELLQDLRRHEQNQRRLKLAHLRSLELIHSLTQNPSTRNVSCGTPSAWQLLRPEPKLETCDQLCDTVDLEMQAAADVLAAQGEERASLTSQLRDARRNAAKSHKHIPW